MDLKVYEKAALLKEKHWWFLGRRAIIEALLNRYFTNRRMKILDVGCGVGANYSLLSDFGKVFGIDSNQKAINICRKIGYFRLIKCDANSLPFEDESFDLIACLDLLEHVPDDQNVLSELARITKKNGYLLATIPAFPFLWGENDIATHHYRRYSGKTIKEKIEKMGYNIVKISYFNFILFFPYLIWFIYKKISGIFRKKKHARSMLDTNIPLFLNKLFYSLFSIESKLLNRFNFPFGISLICLAIKK